MPASTAASPVVGVDVPYSLLKDLLLQKQKKSFWLSYLSFGDAACLPSAPCHVIQFHVVGIE